MKTKQLTVGILAHVDAGKTTLSESILHKTGSIENVGRVDHKNAFLDTYEVEKNRGITVFSKQAVFWLEKMKVTLLDTPGHVDFSGEMERVLQVLDYAILVINGTDGIQGHTQTLWKLLDRYHVPTFIFVNKMDQAGVEKEKLMTSLQTRFGDSCIEFIKQEDESFYEQMAMCDEILMEEYIENGEIGTEAIKVGICRRHIFPVFFGSALKEEGIDELLEGIKTYAKEQVYPDIFGARVFKITRDQQGNRLTHVKITGGSIKVKDTVKEKINEIRIYSGTEYEVKKEVMAGTICAFTGFMESKIGEGLGFENDAMKPSLTPVLSYKILLPEETNEFTMLQNLRELEEEEPHLHIHWDEKLHEIHVKVMGEIQIEILKTLLHERYGVDVEFGAGNLVYMETIEEAVIGLGHFEPLKHYAEVHLLIEPLEEGSGLEFKTAVSTDVLSKNWQNLVITHLQEKSHTGVLTGAELTDIRMTLIAGRGHLKHTDGGDFRQATYRAIRQGLMQAKSVLLEPIYEYELFIPKEQLGRAMSDIEIMYGTYEDPIIEEDLAILKGTGPVATMMHYPLEVSSYSKGLGKIILRQNGYAPCHNQEEIVEQSTYQSMLDMENIGASVFCKGGAGFLVPWNEVASYMHVESRVKLPSKEKEENEKILQRNQEYQISTEKTYSPEELEKIFVQTYGPIRRKIAPGSTALFDREDEKREKSKKENLHKSRENWQKSNQAVKDKQKEAYLLVDGYNIIFAWEELKEMAKTHLDLARQRLMDILSNYQSQTEETIILVFDAYRVTNNYGSSTQYGNIYVVYTKEAETADQYIEKTVHKMRPKYEVTVATSDMVEQVIIFGKGARKMTALGLKEQIDSVNKVVKDKFLQSDTTVLNRPFSSLHLQEESKEEKKKN